MAQQYGRRCHSVYRHPSAEIVLNPEDKYTFRYESEKRFQGTLSVTIRVNDYEGPVKAVLACVTADDEPPKFEPWPHPNKLVCPRRRKKCKDGVCTIERKYITKKKNLIEFNQIGIIRVKRDVAEAAMRKRTSNTDFPYARDYNEDIKAATKTWNASRTHRVRLACQVLIQDAEGALTHPLKPAVTTRVTHYPEKLQIMNASHDRGYATGGLRVFLFTAKLPDSVVVVFRERDSEWRAQGGAVRQHKKVALQFTTPRYHIDYELLEPVKVYYFIAESMDTADEQPADDNRRDFTYWPVTDQKVLKDKLNKTANKTAQNFFSGVISAAVAPTHQHGGGGRGAGDTSSSAVWDAPTHQHEVGPTDYVAIPTSELGEPYIPESQHPQQREDPPATPELLDYVMQLESQGMEVDTIARDFLLQPRAVPSWLLDQPMDEDVAGSNDLPD